jgi:tetratricopeptide (TPR) repeat protein
MLGVYYTSLGDLDQALSAYDQLVELRPDDWFVVNYRGALHYLQGDYAAALADLERTLELGPKANFPYLLLAMIAMHQGELAKAQTYWQTAIEEFPDIAESNRLIDSMFGDRLPNIFGPTFAAAGNLILGQYEVAIAEADKALAINDQVVDIYMVQGLAYCNLEDYAAAEDAYTRGITLDPDFVVLRALRAEVRLRQNDLVGLTEDMTSIQQSEQAALFAPLLEAGLEGDWRCQDFFNYDYEALSEQDHVTDE